MGRAIMTRTLKGKKINYLAKLVLDDDNNFQAFWLQDENICSDVWDKEDCALEELLFMIENRGK
jgi:hypothetical protein